LQKTIAFFDFDGTITKSDTMLELIKFSKGKTAYFLGMMILSPYLIAMKFGLISNTSAKEKMLTYFFGGTSVDIFDETCHRFISDKLPSLIRPKALKKINEHITNHHEVVVVSASAANWISEWCNDNGVNYLSTQLEINGNKITGKLNGPNCNGAEKVARIKNKYNLSDYSTIYCYGDTKGDKPMLQLATFAFYKPFRS
jgi:phosphatidylglycerophosphatase C